MSSELTSKNCGIDFSLEELDMRRKAQVLQYNSQQNNWTKNERFSYLVKNKTGIIKNKSGTSLKNQIMFNAGVYTAPSTYKLICDPVKNKREISIQENIVFGRVPRSSKFLLNTGNFGLTIPSNPGYFSNVPTNSRGPRELFFNKTIPLTRWKYKIQYSNTRSSCGILI